MVFRIAVTTDEVQGSNARSNGVKEAVALFEDPIAIFAWEDRKPMTNFSKNSLFQCRESNLGTPKY
jgi:hypothetical protein